MNHLGFDIESNAAKLAISALSKLKATVDIEDRGAYYDGRWWTCIWLDTEMTEDELDAWLYKKTYPGKVEGNYGTFVRENYRKEDGYLFERLDARPLEEMRCGC